MVVPSNPSARVATGVHGLDVILGGGFPRDRMYLLQGDPGVGKTTLALQFLLEGRRMGETCLYVTLGETLEELSEVASSHGWSLEGISVFEVSSEEAEAALTEDESYDVFHPSEVELGHVMRALLEEAEKTKPVRVVIDSLSEVRLLSREPLRYRRQLLALKHFFTQRGCTVLLLDAGPTGQLGELQSNTLVHGVILMEQTLPAFGLKRRRLSVVKMRGVAFDDGYHDFRVRTGGLDVYPRLIAAQYDKDRKQSDASSGLPELDLLMGGGLPRGTSTILLGAAGVGKSTLAAQYAAAGAARGERSAIFTFDESRRILTERCEGVGIDLEQQIDGGLVQVVQVDPGELTPGEFSANVREAVQEGRAEIVIIDSLNGYLNATPDERFLLVQLHELLTYLGNMGVCTLLVVSQHGLVGQNIEAAVDASYLADAVLTLRYFEHAGEVRKAISVMKKRTGPHELTIREFEISPGRLRVGEPLREFHGILSGIPIYGGSTAPLLDVQERSSQEGAGYSP